MFFVDCYLARSLGAILNPPISTLVTLGIGWVALICQLVEGENLSDLVMVVSAIVLCEVLSTILITTIAPKYQSLLDRIAGVLIGWLIICAATAGTTYFHVSTLFEGRPFLILCILSLTLVLGLLKLTESSSSTFWFRFLIPGRLILSAAIIYFCQQFADTSADIIIVSILFWYLVLLAFSINNIGILHVRNSDQSEGRLTFSAQYFDLLIIPFFLTGVEALAYILARGSTVLISTVLIKLNQNAIDPLTMTFHSLNRTNFLRKAAQLNLGFLLIGGAVAITVIALGPFWVESALPEQYANENTLNWLVFGAMAPAIFGATDSLLTVIGRQNTLNVANGLVMLCLSVAVIKSTEESAYVLAQSFAIVQIARAGLCAAVLARASGIWPGMTALLQTQIRLR